MSVREKAADKIGVDVRPALYPNLMAAMRILSTLDVEAIDKARVEWFAENEKPESERRNLEQIRLALGIGGNTIAFEIERCDWNGLRLLTKAADVDEWLSGPREKSGTTLSFVDRCADAIRRRITPREMFAEMRRGRDFDEDVEQLAMVAAERARSSAGKDVA